MSLARNLSKFKPSSSGLVETADIADDAVTAGKIEHNPAIVGNIEPTGSVRVADSQYFQAGNSYDLQMYHDGSNSYIEDQGTGDLILKGTAVRLRTDNLVVSNTANNEDMITASADGAVNLRHNNVSCLTTTSGGGITVHGDNIVIGTAGKGIDFSAQTHATSTSGAGNPTVQSEVLSHYEEGEFNYGFNANMTQVTNANYGRYTRVGNLVTVNARMDIASISGSNVIFFANLPFAVSAHTGSGRVDNVYIGSLQLYNIGNGGYNVLGKNILIENASGTAYCFYSVASGTHAYITNAMASTSSELYMTLTYRTG